MTTTSEAAPVGFSHFGLQESIGRWQERNADGLRGMFRQPETSELFIASGSSLRICGGGGNDVARLNRSRDMREERIRPGTPSRAPDLLLDSVGGRFVPASVR